MGVTGIPQPKEEASIFPILLLLLLLDKEGEAGSTSSSRKAWTCGRPRRYSAARVRSDGTGIEMREPASLETKFRDGEVQV